MEVFIFVRIHEMLFSIDKTQGSKEHVRNGKQHVVSVTCYLGGHWSIRKYHNTQEYLHTMTCIGEVIETITYWSLIDTVTW